MVSIRFEDRSIRSVPLADLRIDDFAESVPWRKVRSVHGMAHYSGSYASATTGGHVVYESRLELARLLLADFDGAVCGIFAQPCLMVAAIGGRVRRHVPDFLLVSTSSTVMVVNVKPAARLADPKVAQALAWPGELVEGHGWRYEVWSGADPVVLGNVRFLAAYRRAGLVPPDEVDAAWASVRDGDQIAAAEQRLADGRPRHLARPSIMALLWSGRLTADLSLPLSGDTVLRRAA